MLVGMDDELETGPWVVRPETDLSEGQASVNASEVGPETAEVAGRDPNLLYDPWTGQPIILP